MLFILLDWSLTHLLDGSLLHDLFDCGLDAEWSVPKRNCCNINIFDSLFIRLPDWSWAHSPNISLLHSLSDYNADQEWWVSEKDENVDEFSHSVIHFTWLIVSASAKRLASSDFIGHWCRSRVVNVWTEWWEERHILRADDMCTNELCSWYTESKKYFKERKNEKWNLTFYFHEFTIAFDVSTVWMTDGHW